MRTRSLEAEVESGQRLESGSDMFGFTHPEVSKMIQVCQCYQFLNLSTRWFIFLSSSMCSILLHEIGYEVINEYLPSLAFSKIIPLSVHVHVFIGCVLTQGKEANYSHVCDC